jgi:hypothetical protein
MTEPLTLWTIQRRADWERALAAGVLRADPNRRDEYFGAAYEWMAKQAGHRLHGYAGGPLLWAWYRPKPNIYRGGHLATGEDAVRVEFSTPREAVLLSHFMAWHMVLNDRYTSISEPEYECFEARHLTCCELGSQTPACRAEIEASWERVFNLEAMTASGRWGRSPIQAVLEAIPLSAVREATHFTAR